MERRTFLAATAAVPLAAAAPPAGEVYDLRTYTLPADRLPALDDYLKSALMPAAKRLGLGPVGAFLEVEATAKVIATGKTESLSPGPGNARLTVLLVHPSAESAVTFAGRLARDADHLKAAGAYWAADPTRPAYDRVSSSLLVPTAGMPKLDRPDVSKPRLFALRTYDSHSERAAAKKVEMFDTAELAIFRRVGLTPVFFAAAVSGPGLPHLTYLLTFPDAAAREAAWGRFRTDQEWVKLRATPGLTDPEIVSRVVNRVLTPRPYSEV